MFSFELHMDNHLKPILYRLTKNYAYLFSPSQLEVSNWQVTHSRITAIQWQTLKFQVVLPKSLN